MKRFWKLFTVVFAIVLTFAVCALAISAADESEFTVEWNFGGKVTKESVDSLPEYEAGTDYAIYNNEGWRASYKVTKTEQNGNTLSVTLDPNDVRYYSVTNSTGEVVYNTSSTLGKANAELQAVLSGTETNITVQLLSDVIVNVTPSISARVVYLDLNGFNYYAAKANASGNAYGFSVGNKSKLYVYSSRPDGNIFNGSPYVTYNAETKEYTDTGVAAYTCFSMGGTAQVILGEVNGCDGNNLSIYANMLANISSTYSEGVNAITINGGYYNKFYAAHSTMPGMFYFRDGAENEKGYINVEIKNATLNSNDNVFNFYKAIQTSEKRFNVSVDNCVIKSKSAIVVANAKYLPRMNVVFTNSYLLNGVGVAEGVTLGEGCRTISNGETTENGIIFAKTREKKNFSFKTNTFSFGNYSAFDSEGNLVVDKNGNPVITFDILPSSSDVVFDSTEYFFNMMTATEETSSKITWVSTEGERITEAWVNGIVPRPAIPLPDGNDSYYYTYGNIVAVNGDKTYYAKAVSRIQLQMNLTLASDFIYNVYIPAKDIESIKEVRVGNTDGLYVTLTRDSEPANIFGVPHYRYWFNIPASKAADEYYFDMDVYSDKAAGEYFTQECYMSIPAYSAKIVDNTKYNENTRNLMKRTLVYVKSCCDYFKTADSNAYYNYIDTLIGSQTPNEKLGEKATLDSASTVYDVLDNIRVVFGSQLRFRYYFKSDVDFTRVDISYYKNGKIEKVSLNDELVSYDADSAKYYYDVVLRAADMREDMVISAAKRAEDTDKTSTSFTYNLMAYIYAVNNANYETDADKLNAQNLVWSLWDYSESAGMFVNENPTTGVKINDTPIEEYKLVANTEEELAAAEAFKAIILEEYGKTLEIVGGYSGKTIEFRTVSPDSLFDYEVSVDGENLVIECAYKSFFKNATVKFTNDVLCNLSDDLNLAPGYTASYFYGKILYSDFDVPTCPVTASAFDGKSVAEINEIIEANSVQNAYFAIKHAHDVANSKGYSVYADENACYYLGTTKNDLGKIETITIKTSTYWNGSDFIIDDSALTNRAGSENSDVASSNIFEVANDYSSISISSSLLLNKEGENRPLWKDETKLDSGLGYPAMLVLYNSGLRHYIRYGYENNTGKSQQELILVDKDGNIDPSTPLLFDYENVTSIAVYRADSTPIVIDGGDGCVLTTLSSQTVCHNDYKSIGRAFVIKRPNTTLKNVEHSILNEPAAYNEKDTATGGHSYGGFYSISNTTNVILENCVMQGRKRCMQGTYDIGITSANDVKFLNCTQSDFFTKDSNGNDTNIPDVSKKWWVMGSNYCKNLSYDSCRLTRFDAHAGVYNATIKNSDICSIRLTGGGTFLLENTTVYDDNTGKNAGFVELRSDYGSTWNGDIIIRDCVYDLATNRTPTSEISCVDVVWEYHNFGYQITLPNVIIDNLDFSTRVKAALKTVYVFDVANSADATYTYQITEDGIEKTVELDLTEIKSRFDLTSSVFENVNITMTKTHYVTEEVELEDGTTETVTTPVVKTEILTSLENINPYNCSEYVKIVNNTTDVEYSFMTHEGYSDPLFADTEFYIAPPPFDFDEDSPFVD